MLAYVELIKFKRLLKFTGVVLGVVVVEADSGSSMRGRSRREIENEIKTFPLKGKKGAHRNESSHLIQAD